MGLLKLAIDLLDYATTAIMWMGVVEVGYQFILHAAVSYDSEEGLYGIANGFTPNLDKIRLLFIIIRRGVIMAQEYIAL